MNKNNRSYKIVNIVNLNESIFKITLDGLPLNFFAGQHLIVSSLNGYEAREYSIYSRESDENIELLIKVVTNGFFSPALKNSAVGDFLKIDGPHGDFLLDMPRLKTHKHIFIATGTGIAPMHSFIRSHPKIDAEIYHGVKTKSEVVELIDYKDVKYTICTSKDSTGDFSGRLTECIKGTNFDKQTVFYLCGNSSMVFDVRQILLDKGFIKSDIKTEFYF